MKKIFDIYFCDVCIDGGIDGRDGSLWDIVIKEE